MNKIKLLTPTRKNTMRQKLCQYLTEVLKEEDYINTFLKAFEESKVVLYQGQQITPKTIGKWLRGLPIGVEYITFEIKKMLLGFLDLPENQDTKEDDYTIDCYYWETLGEIIYWEVAI
ncbi:MAG: hypothetical protein J6A52_04165 [Bacilli bacterium]|nr:hypothetical protein [Bacilli bacterium]